MPLADASHATPWLSIIIPMLDEAAAIQTTLQRLQALRALGVELIVVDGGSRDGSVALATPLADSLLRSQAGRARQMNLGAQHARGSVLLFLHADTRFPCGEEQRAVAALRQALAHRAWGRFDVQLAGHSRWLPLVAASMNLRSRLSGIATGDQGIFLRRDTFAALEGFPDQPLMEDIELCKRLKRHAHPACLGQKVVSSGRRWDTFGAWRTIRLMWRLRYRYWRGVSATQLAKEYRHAR